MYSPAFAGVGEVPLRAPRANRVFHAEVKRVRAENTVMDKDKDSEERYTVFQPRTIALL